MQHLVHCRSLILVGPATIGLVKRSCKKRGCWPVSTPEEGVLFDGYVANTDVSCPEQRVLPALGSSCYSDGRFTFEEVLEPICVLEKKVERWSGHIL